MMADLRRRLVSNRFPLAAAVGLFVLLLAAGAIGPLAFVLLSAVMVAVSLFAPVRTASARRAARSRRKEASPEFRVYGAALDGIPDPVLVIDKRGVVQHANREYRRVLGTMQPGASVLIRFRSPEMLDMIQRAFAGQQPDPVELVERSPREHWFMVSIAPLKPASRPLIGHVLHFRDLSELRRAERMRTDFIANASHELRTPLASLTGFIETLAGPARDDPGAREKFLDIMLNQAERMSRLIDDLLSLSRFETALGRSDFAQVDLVDALVHVVGALQPVAARSDIVIKLDRSAVPGGIATVHGSRDELIQLFENLVENAIKYGGAGKRVDITISPAKLGGLDAWAVAVRDHGPGIDEEHIPRLTERFYRVDVASSRDKQGTGLGLAIVKHIVTRHEGRLIIQSRLGEGTTCSVTFPATVADKAEANPEKLAISET
ncbi:MULTISPECIES: ATP-binding protein [unclassified Roseitalea]|uniref:ATP-binding protein n=1 Tax=unclassified Roseitalea TaxID=2639107 RepID=UPI0027402FAA|nr:MULTISPECIES: ATP-binding protein [unclassified Roseitalea]